MEKSFQTFLTPRRKDAKINQKKNFAPLRLGVIYIKIDEDL